MSVRNPTAELSPIPDEQARPKSWGRTSMFEMRFVFGCHGCALGWAVWLSENTDNYTHYRVHREPSPLVPGHHFWVVDCDQDLSIRNYVTMG